jgi:hypothetical protein
MQCILSAAFTNQAATEEVPLLETLPRWEMEQGILDQICVACPASPGGTYYATRFSSYMFPSASYSHETTPPTS